MYSYLPPENSAAAGGGQPCSNSKSYPLAEATYHEIVQNPHLFLQKLRAFHSSFGTKFKLPTVGGSILDLHRLFIEVTSRGGIEKVVKERTWKDVAGSFRFPSSITSASYVLRNHYLSLLYHFEQVYYFRKGQPAISPSEVPFVEPGFTVTGTIDSKFDCGYLVTVNLGSEKLKGVLYHSPNMT